MTILEDAPRKDIVPTAAEFQEAVATVLGAASPLCKDHIGRKIHAVNDRQSREVDGMGFNLTTVVGTKHQHRYALHNSMVRLLAKETKEAKGSAVINPSGLLFAKINPEVLARNKDKKLQKEIWPDLLLHPLDPTPLGFAISRPSATRKNTLPVPAPLSINAE